MKQATRVFVATDGIIAASVQNEITHNRYFYRKSALLNYFTGMDVGTTDIGRRRQDGAAAAHSEFQHTHVLYIHKANTARNALATMVSAAFNLRRLSLATDWD